MILATFALSLAAPLHANSTAQTDFSSVWYDGRAEVSGYRWSGTRYGELRKGEAVAIFVTEPFNTAKRVKSDRSVGADVVTAMKLNLVRDFQTGIYDYNTMSSVFVDVDRFAPLKLSFSSAEWCGHVYEEIDAGPTTRVEVRSYFEDESGVTQLAATVQPLIGDQLLVWLRGLQGAPLAPGESIRLPFLTGAFERRLRHAKADWGTLEITRDPQTRTVSVPAGSFTVIRYRAKASDGRELVVDIASDSPHQLVRWSWSKAGQVTDAGELTGTERLPYWQQHGEGDEKLKGALGL